MKTDHFILAVKGFLYEPSDELGRRDRLEICKAASEGTPCISIPPEEREGFLEDILDRALRPKVPLKAAIESFTREPGDDTVC